MKRVTYFSLSLAAAILALAGCRAHRFRSLRVSPAVTPAPSASPVDPRILSVVRSYAPIGFRRQLGPILYTMNGPTAIVDGPGTKLPCCTFNISNRPAPPNPTRSAYLLTSPKGQAEMVKLFSKYASGKGADDLKLLWSTIYEGDEKVPTSTGRIRVESTFTHLLDSLHDWDRLQYVGIFLLMDDPMVKVVDTNQFESVLRDIEVGTLTQTVTAGATVGGKKTNYTAATLAGQPTSLPVQELTPSVSVSYVDALQRKLREQLNFRSASIEADGQLFRLVQRASAENTIPSMTRQILTLQFTDQLSLARLDLSYTAEKLNSLGVKQFLQPKFCGVNPEILRNNFDVFYDIKATPVMLSAVRRIRNEAGVKSLGFDDDDRVTYDIHLDAKPKVTMASVQVRQWTIKLCFKDGKTRCDYLHVKRNPADSPGIVTFNSDTDASWFSVFLARRLGTMTEAQKRQGLVLEGLEGVGAELLRFGLPMGSNDVFLPADPEGVSLLPRLVPFGQRLAGECPHTISGTVAGPSKAGVALHFTGDGASVVAATDEFGGYISPGLRAGTYQVTPRRVGSTFSPESRTVKIESQSLSGLDFTATSAGREPNKRK